MRIAEAFADRSLTLPGSPRGVCRWSCSPRCLVRPPADAATRASCEAEAKRVAVIEKVKPSVVAVFARGGQGGGSGVLIDDDGYALTNFHVVAADRPGHAVRPARRRPLRRRPRRPRQGRRRGPHQAAAEEGRATSSPSPRWATATRCKAGDWSLAMGNPFLLATDFTPTVTFGLVSGVHRYQYPAGTLLEYTDCIQIDTSINPGNSGGPLFNMDGELIGINGRGSFEKRGRVNSGVGYAISINQIKNFLGHLRAGLDTDHAILGAVVESETTRTGSSARWWSRRSSTTATPRRRGLDVGDELVVVRRPADRQRQPVQERPRPLPARAGACRSIYRRDNAEARDPGPADGRAAAGDRRPDQSPSRPTSPARGRRPSRPPTVAGGQVLRGQGRLRQLLLQQAGARPPAGRLPQARRLRRRAAATGSLEGELATVKDKARRRSASIVKEQGRPTARATPVVRRSSTASTTASSRSSRTRTSDDFKDPPGSGGLLLALYQYRQLLAVGREGLRRRVQPRRHRAVLPAAADEEQARLREACASTAEVLRTRARRHAGQVVLRAEGPARCSASRYGWTRDEDPCEVYLSRLQGRWTAGMLPHRIEVRYGDKTLRRRST